MQRIWIFLVLFVLMSCQKDESLKYELKVISIPSEGGIVNPTGGEYAEGTSITIITQAHEYYQFNKWSGDWNGDSTPLTITMDSNKSIVAEFVKTDVDGDGVNDEIDLCNNTPQDYTVDNNGCSVYLYLASNGVTVKAYEYAEIGMSYFFNDIEYTVVDENLLREMVNNDDDVSTVVTTFVEDLSLLFIGRTEFNQNIGSWDVSNVLNMDAMFVRASSFNQPIANWDVNNVTSINGLFNGASKFNQPIGDWQIDNVTRLDETFKEATSFNQPLNNWNVSNVTSMVSTFYGATSFNQDLSNWDVSNVLAMRNMFRSASSFNYPINNWNIISLLSTNSMFEDAISFNQPLGDWNLIEVITLNRIFKNAISFNQDLSSWDVSNIRNMDAVFEGATLFNQDLSNWNVSNVENCNNFSIGAVSWGLPKPNFINCTE